MLIPLDRSEAAGIPTLLVAPKPVPEEGEDQDRSIYNDGLGDSRGFYSDGAYTAAPILSSSPTPSSAPALRSPRDVYFEKILERFKTLRDRLSNIPPRHVVERLSKDHTSYMSASAEDYRKWRWRITHTEPMTAQLAGMDKGTVLRLLRLVVNDKCALGGKAILTAQLSRWIWGILARLPERGELNSEEIGVVRDLGKRAVWISVEMRGVDTSGLDDGRGDENEEDEEIVLDVEANDSEERPEDGCANKLERPMIGPILPATAIQAREETPPMERLIKNESARAELDRAFWGDVSEQIYMQFEITPDSLKSVAHPDEIPGPLASLLDILRNDNGTATAQDLSDARKRLRSWLKENPVFVRKAFRFVYKNNPLAEKYTGPMPPKEVLEAMDNRNGELTDAEVAAAGERFKDFMRKNPQCFMAFGEREVGRPSFTTYRDDEYSEEEEQASARAWLLAGMHDPRMRADGRAGDEAQELAAARERLLAHLDGVADNEQSPSVPEEAEEGEIHREVRSEGMAAQQLQNARATIDMVITVAGEVYGQRDLLEFREKWD